MSWERLEQELDHWAADRRPATLWWRDDDAVAPTPALERLVRVTRARGIPLALAVIPARAEPGLVHALADHVAVSVLQHGYAHRNHAAEGIRAVECGGARPIEEAKRELAAGCQGLAALFGPRFLPVLVPPWNRIDPALVPALPDLGFVGLSTWDARQGREAAPGLPQVHTHADPIAWRNGRVFRGVGPVTDALADHLEARRRGRADPEEPTGLLTHHLAHDEPGWAFLEETAERLSRHPAVRWLSAPEAFGTAA